jgi:hypothetical protein
VICGSICCRSVKKHNACHYAGQLLRISAAEVDVLRESLRLRLRSSGESGRLSSNCFLLGHARAVGKTAFGIAESADINVQLSKDSNQSAPVHLQYSSGLALVPVDISENDQNKLLFEFFQRLVIQDACPVHPPHQRLKLGLRCIRLFSTHAQPREVFARARWRAPCQATIAPTDSVRLLGGLVNYVRKVQSGVKTVATAHPVRGTRGCSRF